MPLDHIVKVMVAVVQGRVKWSDHALKQHGRELFWKDHLHVLSNAIVHVRDGAKDAPPDRFLCWAVVQGVGLCRVVYVLNADGSVFVVTAMVE